MRELNKIFKSCSIETTLQHKRVYVTALNIVFLGLICTICAKTLKRLAYIGLNKKYVFINNDFSSRSLQTDVTSIIIFIKRVYTRSLFYSEPL